MGQQQLILLVLATVIVGLATVVGIRAFSENSDKANADAMMQDAVRMANDAQAALQKPEPFGGVAGFDEITLGVLGYPNDGTNYTNANGQYSLSSTADGVVITGNGGTSTTTDGVTTFENRVVVAVCGPTDQDITGEIMTIGNQATNSTEPSCTQT